MANVSTHISFSFNLTRTKNYSVHIKLWNEYANRNTVHKNTANIFLKNIWLPLYNGINKKYHNIDKLR